MIMKRDYLLQSAHSPPKADLSLRLMRLWSTPLAETPPGTVLYLAPLRVDISTGSMSDAGAGAVAGDPARVLEPVEKMLEGERRARQRISVVIYLYTGRQWFFTIPKDWCEECDLLVALVEGVIKELGIEKAVDLKIRPWWIFLWLPLFTKGAWHAPILLVNGKVFSQGIVPDKKELKNYLSREAVS